MLCNAAGLREGWTLFLRVCANVLCAEQVYQLSDGEEVMQRCFFPPPAMALPDHAPAGKFGALISMPRLFFG